MTRKFISIIFLIVTLIKIYNEQNISKYFQVNNNSNFIEENYIDPFFKNIKFPKNKRNLILFILESLETTFSSINEGGNFQNNVIPELTKLALDENNIHFSNTNKLGGTLNTNGASWTIASIFASLFGLPTKFSIINDNIKIKKYIPGAIGLPEILQDNDYKNYILLGHNKSILGNDSLFYTHGNFTIFDHEYFLKNNIIPKNYIENWGVEDKILYNFTKNILPNLIKESNPFLIIINTLDTHFPEGFKCSLCENNTNNKFDNTRYCASRQFNNFVKWFKNQDFFQNTTLVGLGDHLTMGEDVDSKSIIKKERTLYNVIINSPIKPIKKNFRIFSQFDWFPTLLATLNVSFEGNKLGLGTNLFSNESTLFELYSQDYVNKEIIKSSTFYDNHLLIKNGDPRLKINYKWM